MKRRNFLSAITAVVCAPTAVLASLSTVADPNTGLRFPAADTMVLSTNGSERARIDASGNLGIGDAAPTHRLQVRDNGPGLTIPVIHRDNCYDLSSVTFGNL
jgi:hypothetical protein